MISSKHFNIIFSSFSRHKYVFFNAYLAYGHSPNPCDPTRSAVPKANNLRTVGPL